MQGKDAFMRGKIVGFNVFEGKKEGSGQWCNVYFALDMPEGGHGVRVEKFMCRPAVLPDTTEKLLNKSCMFSTRNNFLDDVVLLDK